ncbi:MAG: hypothetical protein WCY09_05695 [Candidatus Omnitrophota bacterium]
MFNCNKKGMILFIVVAVIIVVSTLAMVILRTVSNQARLSHHQVSRIQAQYAARAGMIYAFEQLRTGTWKFSPNSCPDSAGCAVVDDFGPSVKTVKVIFCPSGAICAGSSVACRTPAGFNFCVNTVVDYTYP